MAGVVPAIRFWSRENLVKSGGAGADEQLRFAVGTDLTLGTTAGD